MPLTPPISRRHFTRSRPFLILLAAAFLLTVAIARVSIVYRLQLLPVLLSHRAVQEKHLALFEKDLQDLSQQKVFPHITVGKSDAGAFLNHRLSWMPRGLLPQAHPIVQDEVRGELVRYGNTYLEHPSHFTNYHTDLEFFSHLDGYDYWDIESRSPIEDLIHENRFVPPNQLPVPDPLDLIAASKLRLMTGTTGVQYAQSMRDVRELARLLLTTENSQLITAGLSILEDERYAYYFYVHQNKMSRDQWQPISGKLLTEARRSFDAAAGYLSIWTEPSVMKRVFLKETLPLGICSDLNDALPKAMTLRRYLEPRLPFELDYQGAYQTLDQVVAKAKPMCRMRYLSQLLKTGNFPQHLPGFRLQNGAPYWRKLFALHSSLAHFSNFDAYERLSVVSHQASEDAKSNILPEDD